jgi:hypothetical protein
MYNNMGVIIKQGVVVGFLWWFWGAYSEDRQGDCEKATMGKMAGFGTI